MHIAQALHKWDIGIIADIEELSRGAVNRTFRVVAEIGVFYLRCYRTNDATVVIREHELIQDMARAGLPVLRPQRNLNSSSIVLLENKIFALFLEAPGSQIERENLTFEHAKMAGEMLARVHQTLKDRPNMGYRRYIIRWDKMSWIARLVALEQTILSRKHLAPDRRDDDVLQRLHEQRLWLESPSCRHEHEFSFKPQVIHGDYHHGNLFFSPLGITAIIDWEQAAFMPRAFEIARALTYMFESPNDPLTQVFIESYRALLPLSVDELVDGEMAWGCMSDHYVWAVEEVYLHGNEKARSFIPLPFKPFLGPRR